MEAEIALLWDRETPYEQYLREHGFRYKLVQPQHLAAPFFSWRSFRLMIVPAGFGNSYFSGMLAALRANREAITAFVRDGGTLLVSGALAHSTAYDWLPLQLEYVRKDIQAPLERKTDDAAAQLVEQPVCFCDGYLETLADDWDEVLTVESDSGACPVLVVARYGAGKIVVSSIHEYPSERFLQACLSSEEG
ncbi:MAG TPA: hypothetical protein ENN68_03005 [Methanomicrobia archaeon]|nr:hypothetical protein [Methanomicrobia archaeon]